jgi:hypothetical protein
LNETQPISTIVFVYNSFKDPLFQNLVFQYIDELSIIGRMEFHVITFEQNGFFIPSHEKEEMQADFKRKGLYWYPLNYAYGPVLLLNKFKNLIQSIQRVRSIKRRNQSRNLLCFGNVAASFGGLLTFIFGFKSIIIQYEPHHLFLSELNRWNKNALKYRILSSLEDFARVQADYIMTGTSHMIKELEAKGTKAKLFRTPNAVDENLMNFDAKERETIRKQLDIQEKDAFIYIGKLGELYYEEELVEVCAAIYQANSNAVFLLITGYDHLQLKKWLEKWRVPDHAIRLMNPIAHREVPKYLSAADMGVVAIPPTPAQKFRSPLKTAEYLYCGLPYLICRGISEDDDYAEKNKVGVVIDEFTTEQIHNHYFEIEQLLTRPKDKLRSRCRAVGLEYRSREKVMETINLIISSDANI